MACGELPTGAGIISMQGIARQLRRYNQHPARAARLFHLRPTRCSRRAPGPRRTAMLNPLWAGSARPQHELPRPVRSRWQAARRRRRVPDSPVSSPADRLPCSEIAWRDFETAPIVASLPARPHIPWIPNVSQLRRKHAVQQPRQMLLNTSLIRCSRAISSA